MNQPTLFDLHKSRDARDKGIEQVTHNNENWYGSAINKLAYFADQHPGWEGSGEDIRRELRLRGLDNPKHPNAWGGLIVHAVKIGLIKDTGKLTQMTAKKSHARRTPVWRFV